MDQAFLGFILPVASIVPVTVFDLKYRIIPDWLTLPLLTAGLAFSCAPQGITPYLALAGVFCGGGTLWAIEWIGRHVTGKEGMGGGDIKYMAALGAFIGPIPALALLCIASITALLFSAGRACRTRQFLGATLPFGPFLCAGLICTLVLMKKGIF